MSDNKKRGCGCGIGTWGVGSIVAMIISWTSWHSILWMLFHGFLGWVYVIYFVLFH